MQSNFVSRPFCRKIFTSEIPHLSAWNWDCGTFSWNRCESRIRRGQSREHWRLRAPFGRKWNFLINIQSWWSHLSSNILKSEIDQNLRRISLNHYLIGLGTDSLNPWPTFCWCLDIIFLQDNLKFQEISLCCKYVYISCFEKYHFAFKVGVTQTQPKFIMVGVLDLFPCSIISMVHGHGPHLPL